MKRDRKTNEAMAGLLSVELAWAWAQPADSGDMSKTWCYALPTSPKFSSWYATRDAAIEAALRELGV